MRQVSSTQRSRLLSPHRSDHLRVLIEDGDGDMRDLRELVQLNDPQADAKDWIMSGSTESDIDQITDLAEISLWRAEGPLSLVPTIEGSDLNFIIDPVDSLKFIYAPLLELGRRIEVYGSVGQPNSGPEGWEFLLAGRVDSIEWGSETIEISARDMSGVLQDALIDEERDYGDDEEVLDPPPDYPHFVENVMQSIIEDNFEEGELEDIPEISEIYIPVSPNFIIHPEYTQERVQVMDALDTLATLKGWIIKQWWDDVESRFRLKLFPPLRDEPQVEQWHDETDVEFGPDDYFDVSEIGVDIEAIRNEVWIEYFDGPSGQRYTAKEKNQSSIDKYKRRLMQIDEPDDSPIQTIGEAKDLAQFALYDLSEPYILQEIEMPFFWPVQLLDHYRFKANGVHYDTDQEWSVVKFRHEFNTNGTARTYLSVRGRPAGAYFRWHLFKERRRHVRDLPFEEVVQVRVLSAGFQWHTSVGGTNFLTDFIRQRLGLLLYTEVSSKTRALHILLEPYPRTHLNPDGSPQFSYWRDVEPDTSISWFVPEPGYDTDTYGSPGLLWFAPHPQNPNDPEWRGVEYILYITPYPQWDSVSGEGTGPPGKTVEVVLKTPAEPEVVVSTQEVDPSWNPLRVGSLWLRVRSDD